MRKIYVICPYGLVTGGPDALHQMVYYLNNNGYNAQIVYSDIKSYKYEIPQPYQIYIDKYLILKDIEDCNENVIVVPETQNNVLNNYKNLKKYIWWLSVNNDLEYSGFKNKIKKILSKISFQNLKKLYKINTLKNVILHKKFDFTEASNIEHLCASYYAYDYVCKNEKDKEKIHICIEPISKIFLEKSKLITENKSNIILYNPKKNFEFTRKIIEKIKNYECIPLKGFNQEELISVYQKAKLYIDFGTFPGAERIPKEAVINGCCILTGKNGAANYYLDVPIEEKYKIEANEENIDEIITIINFIMENYENQIKEFSQYRETVLKLENNFIEQLKGVFVNE